MDRTTHCLEVVRPSGGAKRAAFALMALLVTPAVGAAQEVSIEVEPLVLEASPPAPLLKRTVPLHAEYLMRVGQMALERDRQAEAEKAARRPAPAAIYAKRYGISRDLAQLIVDAARDEGIDPELGFRLVRVESRFKTRARGPAGALGLAQLMPGTARSIDRSLRTEAQIMEPRTNLRLGFRYLRTMIDRYRGDVRLGLLAYNRGEVAVDRALRRGANPENGYSHKVLGTRSSNPYRGKGRVATAD